MNLEKFKKGVLVATVNILLFALVVEIAGLVYFTIADHQFFYTRCREKQAVPEEQELLINSQLHPIFGFIRKPGLPITDFISRERLDYLYEVGPAPPWGALTSNNFGFFSPYDYPYRPQDKPFIIAVFGGSVAQWLAIQGEQVLIKKISGAPGLENRRIEILNFAQGAFKQPQQMQILTYFLVRGQPLDFVINIDGVNEVALGLINVEDNIDPSLPASQKILPLAALVDASTLHMDQIEMLAAARRSFEQMQALELRAGEIRSAGVWLIVTIFQKRAKQKYDRLSREFITNRRVDASELLYLNQWTGEEEDAEAVRFAVDIWRESSTLMDEILGARGIPYLHIVQPNQYFSKHTFAPQEMRIAIHEQSPYKKPVELGYARIIDEIPKMQLDGINIISAIDIFNDTYKIVYADSCCHFNQAGNEILADFIADQIISFMPR